MLQKVREWLSLVLIALLPFHALAVTVATYVLMGQGHPPISALALWKEALRLLTVVIACIEILRAGRLRDFLKLDGIDAALLLLMLLAFAVTILTGEWTHAAYGFKYDLLVPGAFF